MLITGVIGDFPLPVSLEAARLKFSNYGLQWIWVHWKFIRARSYAEKFQISAFANVLLGSSSLNVELGWLVIISLFSKGRLWWEKVWESILASDKSFKFSYKFTLTSVMQFTDKCCECFVVSCEATARFCILVNK